MRSSRFPERSERVKTWKYRIWKEPEENSQRISEYMVRIASQEDAVSQKKEYAEALRERIAKAEQSNAKAQDLQAQIKITDASIEVMEQMLDAEREDLKWSNSEIKKHFQQKIIKDYEADLSTDFKLRILKKGTDGKMMEVGRSTGEKQITSLVFIASLIGLARRRKRDSNHFGRSLGRGRSNDHGLADQLGGQYRGEITKWLPSVLHKLRYSSPTVNGEGKWRRLLLER